MGDIQDRFRQEGYIAHGRQQLRRSNPYLIGWAQNAWFEGWDRRQREQLEYRASLGNQKAIKALERAKKRPETDAARNRRWRHNGYYGSIRRALLAMRDIVDGPTTTEATKDLAAKVARDLEELNRLIGTRVDQERPETPPESISGPQNFDDVAR